VNTDLDDEEIVNFFNRLKSFFCNFLYQIHLKFSSVLWWYWLSF